MRRISNRRLWIGTPADTANPKALFDAEIQAVIEVADNEAMANLPRELIRFRFPLSDGGDNPHWLLKLAADSVAGLIRAQVPTLVCCSGGMNRSLCVAAAGIALAEGLMLEAAISIVASSGPTDLSAALYDQMDKAIR